MPFGAPKFQTHALLEFVHDGAARQARTGRSEQ
jgi:hypothetical protein